MKISVPVACVLTMLSAPSLAREVKVGPERYAVSMPRTAVSSSTPALARQALRRIDRAATAACGGAGGSLREVTKAVQASACWREAVGDTVRRIDAPLLTLAWQKQFVRRPAHD